ncbi:MAG: hypothetical protein ACI37R_08130 [Candidatus Avigastranaerophilus sp.]
MDKLRFAKSLIRKATTIQAPLACLDSKQANGVATDVFVKRSKFITKAEAKEKCIQALKQEYPTEKAFVLDLGTNELLQERCGTKTHCSVNVDDINLHRGFQSLIHGHPRFLCKDGNYYSAPLSIDDYRLFNNSRLHEIVAVDEFGRESKMVKNKDYKSLSSKKIKILEQELFKALFKTLPQETIIKIKENPNDANYAFSQVAKHQTTKAGMEALDNFWKNIAPSLNLTYTSNLTY